MDCPQPPCATHPLLGNRAGAGTSPGISAASSFFLSRCLLVPTSKREGSRAHREVPSQQHVRLAKANASLVDGRALAAHRTDLRPRARPAWLLMWRQLRGSQRRGGKVD